MFLRLGTLLAERLLYIPSIGTYFVEFSFSFVINLGFCIIAAVLLYKCIVISNCSKALLWLRLAYFCAIFAAVTSCIYRARERNLDWRDDEALFRSSLEVCPRSAKLQLQVNGSDREYFLVNLNEVAKLEVNSGNYAQAERHISAAKEIDPDFCDVGYQEAL